MPANFPNPGTAIGTRARRAIQKSSVKLGPGAEPTWAGITITGLTASRLACTDADKKLASVADLTSWIAGTTNRVTVVDDGDGSITLSGPQDIHTGASPTFANMILADGGALKVADGSPQIVLDNTNGYITTPVGVLHGVGHAAPPYTLTVGSADGSDALGFYHDNTDAYVKWTDGGIILQSDEGTNAITYVNIKGKGNGQGILRVYDQDNAEYIQFNPFSGRGYLSIFGTSPVSLILQKAGNIPVEIFAESPEGNTAKFKIYGYKNNDSLRSLEIGVGVDVADTASFDGLSNYWFDGSIAAANYTAANLLTACATNAGGLDFTAASKTLSIDETETISNYHTDARAATWLAANHETTYTHSDIALNTTHRGSNGSDHSYLDQAVTIAASPTFAGLDLTGLTDEYVPYVSASGFADSPLYRVAANRWKFEGTASGINWGLEILNLDTTGVARVLAHNGAAACTFESVGVNWEGGNSAVGDMREGNSAAIVASNARLNIGCSGGPISFYAGGFDAANKIANISTAGLTMIAGDTILPDGGALKVADGSPQIVLDNTNGYIEMTGGNVGINTATPDTKLQVVGDCKFGDDNTNYASFASDGELTLTGTARFTNEKPATEVTHGLLETPAWQFANQAVEANQESVTFGMRIPERMDRSVAPTLGIGWSADGISPGVCEWRLEYLWISPGESTAAAAQETLSATGTATATANGMVVTSISGIDVPSETDVCIHCRLTRLSAGGNDTIADTVELHGVCLSWTSNKLGGTVS